MTQNEFAPVAPGEMLKEEFLAEYGLSQNQLAKAIGISPNRIAEIVNNRRRITADTALRLSLYFGNSPEFWMNLQTHYDLKLARRNLKPGDAKRIKAVQAAQSPKDTSVELVGSKAVISNIQAHVAAIRLCLESHLRMPALVLIYCGIDVLANLCRPAANSEVKSADFVNWAERYMECKKRLGVAGLDLYAARCGVLHTYTMDSRLSANGQARRILYAWGGKTPDEPMKLLRALGRPEVMIKIETLFSAFLHGIEAFGKVVDDDPKLESLVAQRGRKLFMDQPSFP
jgi:addiction module HigA family antidote